MQLYSCHDFQHYSHILILYQVKLVLHTNPQIRCIRDAMITFGFVLCFY